MQHHRTPQRPRRNARIHTPYKRPDRSALRLQLAAALTPRDRDARTLRREGTHADA